MPRVGCVSTACLWAVCSLTIASVALGIPARTSLGQPEAAAPRPFVGSELPNATLAVSPASWWLETGTTVALEAAWVNVTPGCALSPEWIRWTVASGGAEGTLEGANGSSTVFAADDQGSGTTTVVARGAAALRCGGNTSALEGVGAANLTVAAPVQLGALVTEPNPATPGAVVNVSATVGGGTPPYRVLVSWGDGTSSWTAVGVPGSFSAGHAFGAAGSYRPRLLAVDATGWTADAAVPEPENVSGTFAVAIAASTVVAEVGVPVRFSVAAVHTPRSFSTLFACTDAQAAGSPNGTGLEYGCAFDAPGVFPVSFRGVGGAPPFPLASATLEETVVPSPVLTLLAPSQPGEVGASLYAPLGVSGGVPPFTVFWSLVGTPFAGSAPVLRDGTAYVPLAAATAGTFVWSAFVQDAFGQVSPAVAEPLRFSPRLTVTSAAVASVEAESIHVNLSAGVLGGVAPYAWAVVPSSAAANGTPLAGLLPAPGPFDWNATYRTEATLRLVVDVVDGAGDAASVARLLPTAPALVASASVSVGAGGELTLSAAIVGGVPPYSVRWNDSAGDAWSGTAATAGVLVVHGSSRGVGVCIFELVVTDSFGRSSTARTLARLPGADPVLGGSSSGPLLAGVLLTITVVAGGAWAYWRRRRNAVASPAPPVDVEAVLREVIGPADGIDRGLVEMLAEERGVSAEQLAEALARLCRDGTVRAERGLNGEEVLAWSEPPLP